MAQKSEDNASKDKDTSKKIKDSDHSARLASTLKISGGEENGNTAVMMECESVSSSEAELLQNEDHCETNVWVNFAKHHLTLEDKWIIENGMELTDKHINLSQSLIKQDFPLIQGLRLTLTQKSINGLPTNSIQAIHCKRRRHWIVASNIGCSSG